MRAPDFWWSERPDVRALALSPMGAVFGAVASRRMAGKGVGVGIPVICVGNFVAGGAGKTPTAIAIAEALLKADEHPFFLSRGYGATARPQTTPLLVDPARHGAREVGDEPLLLARCAPTVVAADRVATAEFARAKGASVVVMDDGLQNPSLAKTLCVAVIDADIGIGNGLCIPAGPLRAPLADQMRIVDALVVIGDGERARGAVRLAQERDLPVVHATLQPDPASTARLARQKVIAFAGIGRPEKFFQSLRGIGAHVVQALPFPDHHIYREADISMLKSAARQAGAMLVTTQKDQVRLAILKDLPPIDTLAVTVSTRHADDLDRLVARVTGES